MEVAFCTSKAGEWHEDNISHNFSKRACDKGHKRPVWSRGIGWNKRVTCTSVCATLCVCCVCAKLLQSCLTLCDLMYCNPPGSSVHGILQVRILELH